MKKYNHFLNVIERISKDPKGNTKLSRYIKNGEYANRYIQICREAFISSLEGFWDHHNIKDKPYIGHYMVFTPPGIDPVRDNYVTRAHWGKIENLIRDIFNVNDTNFNTLYNSLALYMADQINIMLIQNNPSKYIKEYNNVDIDTIDMSTEISKCFFDMMLMAKSLVKHEIDIIRTSAEM